MAKEAPPEVKIKKVKSRMATLIVMPYKGCNVYVRWVEPDIFMYDLVFNNQIYSDYFVITPEKGKKKITKKQIEASAAWAFAGATATIEELMKRLQKEMLSNPVESSKIKRAVN